MENRTNRRRPAVVSFRCTEAEAKRIEAAAKEDGMTRAAWCRRLALKRARAAALRDGVAAEWQEQEMEAATTGETDG